MENINNFLLSATALGVPSPEQFQTVDLWEKQNLNSVVICLQSLGRKASTFGKPSIGKTGTSAQGHPTGPFDKVNINDGVVDVARKKVKII